MNASRDVVKKLPLFTKEIKLTWNHTLFSIVKFNINQYRQHPPSLQHRLSDPLQTFVFQRVP